MLLPALESRASVTSCVAPRLSFDHIGDLSCSQRGLLGGLGRNGGLRKSTANEETCQRSTLVDIKVTYIR